MGPFVNIDNQTYIKTRKKKEEKKPHKATSKNNE